MKAWQSSDSGAPLSALQWEVAVPLLANRIIMSQWTALTLISTLGTGVVLALIIGVTGGWDSVGPMLGVFALVGAAFWILGVVVMLLVFGNRFWFRFTLSPQGIRAEVIDKRAKTAGRLAVALGMLTGNARLVGSGLISQSQEVVELEWDGAFRAVAHPRNRAISLRNRWRSLLVIYCLPENYSDVRSYLQQQMQNHLTAERAGGPSPLWGYLGRTALILLASLMLIAVGQEYDLDLLLSMLVMGFALATLWFFPIFGWVVLGLGVLVVLSLAGNAFELRESFFRPGEFYRHYEVFSEEDWLSFGVMGLALGYLCWNAWLSIKGRLPSVLASDVESMGQ